MKLIEMVTNPWIKFLVTGQEPRSAFLCVIARYDAFSFQKNEMLASIVRAAPEVTKNISDKLMFEAFLLLCDNLQNKGEILSPAELEWVALYIKSKDYEKRVEKIVYQRLVSASDRWDKLRQETKWTLSDDERLEIIRLVLTDQHVDAERKVQLSKEFNEPVEESIISGYFSKLLWTRKYDQAMTLGFHDPQVVTRIILANLENGYTTDAAKIAELFLHDDKEITAEIAEITEKIMG